MDTLYLIIVLAPLVGAIIAGLFNVNRTIAHSVTIGGVFIACLLSVYVFYYVTIGYPAGHEAMPASAVHETVDAHATHNAAAAHDEHQNADAADAHAEHQEADAHETATHAVYHYDKTVYTWATVGGIKLEVGFLIDSLTATMMLVVTFVSLMVHIYTIGYMKEDDGYQRFFSYISLFTFSMLMLVMSNNFLQLFFGWEAVGLVSYLLIGFWYKRDSAIYANLKAFLVNRVGDFGFLLGIGVVLMYFNSMNYGEVFQQAAQHQTTTFNLFGVEFLMLTVACILLFVGAMGKSAQFPLHVWLPDSMEGPTPISALIHAATMVTAGIFMVARMSPLFELSDAALSFVLIIGSITALFMGILGLVQNDIKRVVAYSTLSQLGYMTVALGASAYSAAIFHLMTHAFFKALLFLAAGSVIIALHHKQDMRKMGGLAKYMPITYATSLVGTLALIGFPGTSGFFSKDAIIESVWMADRFGASFAYFALLIGVFITALYSFRLLFLVFHGQERMDEHTRSHLHESPAVVTWPLIALAVPSVFIGMIYIGNMVFGHFFEGAIHVQHPHEHHYHGIISFILHSFISFPPWFALAGFGTAYYLYIMRPDLPALIQAKTGKLYTVLENKYYFDQFNDWFFAGGTRRIGESLWQWGDMKIIDGGMVNGSANSVGVIARFVRHVQTGYLYHYAFAMLLGLAVLLGVFVLGM